MDPHKVFTLFLKIKDEDVPLFGMDPSLARPEDLLVTHLPAPPVCIRPSVEVTANITNEDDLTDKMLKMLEKNERIH